MASFYEDYLNNKKSLLNSGAAVHTGNTTAWENNAKKQAVDNVIYKINASYNNAVRYLNESTSSSDKKKSYASASAEIENLRKSLDVMSKLRNWMDEDVLPKADYDRIMSEATIGYESLKSAYDSLVHPITYYNQRNSGYDGSITAEEYAQLVQDAEEQLAWYKDNNATVLLNKEEGLNGETPYEVYGGQYDEEIKAAKKQLEALKSANYEAVNQEKYGSLYENDDFSAMSGTMLSETGDTTYKYINNLDGQRDKWVYDKNIVNRFDKYDYMTDSEVQTYNYIYNTQGRAAAEDYLTYLTYSLNERRAQAVGEKAAETTEENPWWATGARVWNSLMSGKGLLNAAGQKIVNTVREATGGEYRPVDYNRGAFDNAVVANAITNTVSSNLNEKSGTIQLDHVKNPVLSTVLNGKGLGDLYQLGMSMVDSAMVAALAPVTGGTSVALLGGAAGTQGMIDALERGASDSQAITMGILSGAAELVFEKISLDHLLKGDAKNIVLSILAQAGVEGSEELFTSIANTFSDILVMGDKSEYMQKVATYIAQGMTEKEAARRAMAEIGVQLGVDFVGGAISGGVFGAGGYAVNTFTENAAYADAYGDVADAVVAKSLDIDPANAYAQKMQGRLEAGKTLSGGQIKKLVQQNEAGIVAQDTADIQGAATARLAELGETGDIHAIGAALAKQAAGETLTTAEKKIISHSKYGQRVANELNAENIRSGEYTSEWAQKIGTSRINAEEYNALLRAAGVTPESGEATTTAKAKKATEAATGAAVAANGYTASESGKAERKSDGTEVEIESVASTEGGTMTLLLSDGSKVNAGDINFASEGEALVYDAVESLDVSPQVANNLIDTWKNDPGGVTAKEYALGVVDSFRYGSYNMPRSQLETSRFASRLTAVQRNNAYVLGRNFSGKQVATAEAIARRSRIANKFKTAISTTSYGGGKVVLDGVDESTFTERQKASVSALEKVAEALGVSFHLFESDVDAAGNRVGANGWYVPGKGEIHIDTKAGSRGQDTILFTASHELTHYIKDWSPAKFKKLSNFLMQEYGEAGVSVEELVQAQISKAKRNGRDIDYDTAFEEVVADSMETMLADGDVVEKLAKLKAEDRTLWEKIRDFIRELAAKIKEVYAGLTPDSAEGRYVAEMKDKLEAFQNLFTEGLAAASENFRAAAEVGLVIDTETDSVAPIPMMSERSWTESEVDDFVSEYKSTHKPQDGVKYSTREYSYETLTSKTDMAVTTVGGNVPANRADVVAQAKKNAAKFGKFDPKTGGVSVHVKDIDGDVIIGRDGLKHSLDRRFEVNAPVVLKAGEILANSIRINEMTPKKVGANESYVLIGAARNAANELYVVRSVVNRFSNELTSMDVLYAINAKKKPAALLPLSTGKPALGTDSTISIANLLDYVNQYFPDVLPEDVLKHYGHTSRPAGELGDRVLYSDRDTESLSNRSLLANAFEGLAQNDVEKAKMAEYKANIDAINEQERILHETNKEIRELSFATGPRDQARLRELRDKATKAANRIDTYDRKLLRLEASTPLQNVLERAKDKAYKKAREEGKKALEAYREKAEARQQEVAERYRESKKRTAERRKESEAVQKYRERIKADVNEMTEWVLHPNNKDITKHVPDVLKNTVMDFLDSIDFTSKRALNGGEATKADRQFIKRMQAVRDAIKNSAQGEDLYSGYLDLPEGFSETLQEFIDSAQRIVSDGEGEYVINRMNSEQLKDLSKIVRSLKTFIKQMNVFHANAMYQHVYEAGDDTIDSLGRMNDAGKSANGVSNYLFWKSIRPAYAFERFGKGGEAIYDGLRRGQAQLAFNSREIIDFAEETYTAKEVKSWEEKTVEIALEDGETVRMPVANVMSLYKLKDRPQALKHILGEGIRVATFKDGKEIVRDAGHKLTESDVDRMVAALTPRQKQVADKLQAFMAQRGGEWGNHVSVARFGEKLFGEKDYFPIHSDGRHLQADAGDAMEAASLYRLLNMSFTKEVNEKANNRLVLYSIFDVFANHMSSMAQYNAMALPVLDALKWFNYRQRDPATGEKLDSVRDEMNRVYGAPVEDSVGRGKQGYAEHFVAQVLKAFNGTEAQGSANDSIGLKMLSSYNKAAVAANVRVAIQQPTAIIRAGLLIDMKNIVRGIGHGATAIRKNIEEMQKYSGIAAWKDLGFYDVNISRGVSDMIKHKTTTSDWITEKGLWLAEKADKVTWAAIWNACKIEVRQKQKIRMSDPGFYEATAKLFEDVVYKTQVVDSVLTKSEYMRDKSFWAKMTSSFMSEPVTTASMVFDAFDKYSADIQRGNSRQEAWKKNGKRIGRTALVYGIGAAVNAAFQAAADAFRDDDDYEEWLEKYMAAFRENLLSEANPLNKIPVVADAWESLVYGVSYAVNKVFDWDIYANVPQLPVAQMGEQLYKAVEIFTDKLSGEDTNYTWYGGIYKTLQFASGLTGIPMASLTREVIAIWNTTVGSMAPSLKVKTYEPSEKAQIKYAYQDGYLTAEEAMDELLAQSLVEDEDEAYWTMQGWEAGEGYSRYDALHDAIRNGGDVDAAMDELLAHGYEEKTVFSQVRSQIGNWYKDGEITKAEATRMLSEYGGITEEEAREAANKWAFEHAYDFTYSERIDQFKQGNLSASEMLKVMQDYGGKTEDEAKNALSGYIRDGYEEGAFSRSEAYSMLTRQAGLTSDEAEMKLTYIDVKKQYPDAEMDESWVSAYYAEIESSGIDIGTYLEYRTQVKSITGTGKKARRMAVIDSLPITDSQKTALYYSEGWAASTLYEAPWM